MTRKLSGLWSTLMANRAPLASLAVVGTLACTLAVGCGSSNKPGPTVSDGGSDSEASVVAGACATPTFGTASGAVAAGTPVTLTDPTLPANGFIYYTTDQTMPTTASKFVMSGGTVVVSSSETITAVAFAMGSCSLSTPATATYTVNGVVVDAGPTACAAPTFTPGSGAITSGSTVAIVPPAGFPATFPQGNAVIYYTTDGTVPTHASPAYSGPIQVTTNNETIRAIADYPGTCSDSTSALATYTLTLADSGLLGPAVFNPPSATQTNDFLVQLTDSDPAATICFTYGTGAPTCTVTATAATCSGTSQTYNAGAGLGTTGSVSITSGVTNATTGTVTVNAIACAVGGTTTAPVAQTYTLKGAAPTMQGPAPGATLPYLAAGYAPTITSATAGSTVRYTTDGSTPTCATGTLLAMNPGAVPAFTGNSTFNAIACKTGYAPSPVGGPFTYGIILPTPTFVDSMSLATAEGTGTYDGAPTIAFADTAAGVFYCSTTDSSMPTCGTTAGMCTHGTAGGTVAVTTTGTVVTVVACDLANIPSVAAPATYTLQLDAPALNLPGCINAAGTAASCLAAGSTPVPSYDIPTAAAATFVTAIQETLGTLPHSVAAQPTYQFVCAQNNGTPSCFPTGCSTGATLINPAAANSFQLAAGVALAAGGVVKAGDNWSLIGCPGSASTGFLPSTVTKVAFAVPGAAPVPVVVAGTGTGTYNNPVTPTFTNTGMNAENVCYGTYVKGTPPTTALSCDPAGSGACVFGAGYTSSGSVPAGVAGVLTSVHALTLVTPGSGYTSAPTVTIDAPPPGLGAVQAQATATLAYGVALPAQPTTGGAGCQATGLTPTAVTFTGGGGAGATATVTINALDQVTGLTVTNPGSGYATAPTIGFTNCATAPTVTATLVNGVVTGFNFVPATMGGAGYTSVPNVTFTGGGGTGATATATLAATSATAVLPALGSLPVGDNTDLDIIGCVMGSPASPLETYTYNFQEAAPTVADTSAVPSTPVVSATTLSLGDTITLSTTSTLFSTAPKICYTTDGTAPNPACATAGTTTCGANGLAIATTAATFTTNTIKAIACNATSQTAQTDSAAYTAALNLVVATPTASHPGGTYYNVTTPVLATTTPGATICYTTVGAATPSCAAGVCTNGSLNQATTVVPTVNATGTVLKATACVGAYTSGVSTNTYTLSVTPIVLTNDPVLPLSHTAPAVCPAGINVGLDCGQPPLNGTTACSTGTVAAGGATAGATVYYSTDGTPVNSCAAVPNHIFSTNGITLFATAAAAQSVPLTINAIACAPGFGNTPATTLTVPATAYSAAVTFTGVPATDFVVAPTNEDQFADTAGGGFGYFSTNGTNLFIGMDGIAPLASTYVTIYIGNGGTGATGTTTATGLVALPAAAGFQYALQIPTVPGNTGTLYNWTTGGWVAGAAQAVTVNTGMTTEEISIPLTSLPQLATPSTITVMGSEVTGALTAGVATAFTFPKNGASANYAEWIADPTGSCLYPIQAITP